MSEQELYNHQFNEYRREDSMFVITVISIMTAALLMYHYMLPLMKNSTQPIHFNLFGISPIGFIPR